MRCWIFTLFVSGSCSLLMIDPVIVGAMAVCLVFSSLLGSDVICAQLSLFSLYLYSQISIWMCESGVCWRFSQSAANGSVWAATWLLKPLLLRHNERISGEQVEGRLRGMKTDSASGLWMWEICDLVKWSKWLQVASVFKAQFIVFFTQGTKLSRCLLGVRHEPQGIYSMFCKLFKGKELCHIYTYIFLFIYVFSYLVSYHSRYNYDMFHIKATNKYNNEYNKYINIIYLFSFFIYFLFCVFQASAMAN